MKTEPSNERMAIVPQSPQPSITSIVAMLAVLAEARQAAISEETLKLFASQLSHYADEDIRAAIEKLMFTRREDGETAFPDLPTLDERIRDAKNARLRVAREERERAEYEAEERDRREHPENYYNVGDTIHAFLRSKGIEVLSPEPRLLEPPSVEVIAAVLKLFTPADLRAIADVEEKRAAMKTTVRTV